MIIRKAREFQKNIYFCFIDYAKAFDCMDHNNMWKILKEMGIPDRLTCLLRNLYTGQKATVRTRNGTRVMFSSVVQCPNLCYPMDCSTPGFPIHHQLLEPTQTHVHQVSDTIQAFHPLSFTSLPAFNIPQHHPQLFSNESALCIRWPNIRVSTSASVLPMNTQD